MVAIQEVSAPVIIGKKHYNLQWFVGKGIDEENRCLVGSSSR